MAVKRGIPKGFAQKRFEHTWFKNMLVIDQTSGRDGFVLKSYFRLVCKGWLWHTCFWTSAWRSWRWHCPWWRERTCGWPSHGLEPAKGSARRPMVCPCSRLPTRRCNAFGYQILENLFVSCYCFTPTLFSSIFLIKDFFHMGNWWHI